MSRAEEITEMRRLCRCIWVRQAVYPWGDRGGDEVIELYLQTYLRQGVTVDDLAEVAEKYVREEREKIEAERATQEAKRVERAPTLWEKIQNRI